MAARIIEQSTTASLAVLPPEDTIPHVSRVAFAKLSSGEWLSLLSDLAAHSQILRARGEAGLLPGTPPDKGDPLAFPRISVRARVSFLSREDAEHDARREAWLVQHPKSALYIDFADFNFVRFDPLLADLNGGFGKAYHLTAQDLEKWAD